MIRAALKRTPLATSAVAYYRMSTDRQDKSIGDQRAAVERYACEHGYKIIREYSDEGISGDRTEKRLAFKRMLGDAQEPADFKVVLCWDQDRFGRFNSIEAGHWIYPLMQAGVRLETIAQGRIDWNDFSGRLMYQIQQEGKHQFLRDMARNSLRGLIARAKAGKWSGSPPFGYRVGDDGHLELGNPTHVEAVREVFRLRLAGMGYRSIAVRLNKLQTPSPTGRPWSHDAVRTVLERQAYVGDLILGGGKPQAKYFTAENDVVVPVVPGKTKQKSLATRVENAHPAIVDRKTYEAVAAMRNKARKPHWRNGKEGAPLAGLLYCGRCGKIMYAQSLQRRAGQKYPNYICSSYHKGHGCGYCAVQQDAILRTVARVVRDEVLKLSSKLLKKAVAKEIERRAAKPQTAHNEVVHRQLAALDKKIETATERLITVDSSLVAVVQQKLLALRQERDVLAASITEAPKQMPKLDPKQVVAKIHELEDLLANGSPAKVREALSGIISRVRLDFKPGKNTKRGQAFELEKGTIFLCTQQCPSPATGR